VGEPVHLAFGQRGVGGEEPKVLGLIGEAAVEPEQPVGVLGPDGAHVGRASVA